MKRKFLILMLGAVLAIFSACDDSGPVLPITGSGASDDPFNHWQGLHMYAAAGSVTPYGLRLSVINNSESLRFGYGDPFRVEQYSGGSWRQVPVVRYDIGWFDIGRGVDPGFIREENIGWELRHGQLQPGKYRIVRKFNSSVYLYAPFTIEQDWRPAHDIWLAEQAVLAAGANARFDGLDVLIPEHGPRGISFSVSNNNNYYSYIIDSISVGWDYRPPGGGHSGATEYSIFSRWGLGYASPSWPFGQDVRLRPGESLSFEVYGRFDLSEPRAFRRPPDRREYGLFVIVTLDVDEDYILEHFSHIIPGLPHFSGHRISAPFEIGP